MPESKPYLIFGYVVAFVSVSAGILVLTGTFIPDSTPSQLRIMFGVVLVLLGAYRGSITWVRGLREKQQILHEDDDE